MWQILISIDWLRAIEAIATILTLYVAYSALHTWKHQSKAQKQTDFLDGLTDKVHEYIQALSQSIHFLSTIHIRFESHKHFNVEPDQNPHSHIIKYIELHGKEDSGTLLKHMSNSNDLFALINSLSVRGQAYKFKNYTACREAVNMLLWQHNRLQAVASVIGSQHMNWNNPEVMKSIESMLTVEPDSVNKYIKENDQGNRVIAGTYSSDKEYYNKLANRS